jgi:predicted RNase H-like nuclease
MKLVLTERAAEALSRLRGNPDFETVLDWLQAADKQSTDALLAVDIPTVFYREQGFVRALREFVKAHTEAPETVERFKETATRSNGVT